MLLDRLTGHRSPYARLADLRADLIAAAERPTEVSTGRRALQLLIQTFFLSPGLLVLMVLTCPDFEPNLIPYDLAVLTAVPIAWTLGAMVLRGGLSYPLAGLALIGRDGRAAGRLACGLRAFLVWAIPSALMASSQWVQHVSPESVVTAWSVWLAGLLLMAIYLVIALLFPSRGPHDRLSGTVVVPI
ncbi:hypothetical protein [Planctomyces sp. SH-PL62]|uniref:hypothetical protein n=1 Tax=Planctomyces sp. SH-PL62 TaxID=1636152 RepID=UPI00078B61EA|nr:hypothetical protein [Planctomyces sp. SH-PL62]AMV37112.1 hypothetical protein VT85_06750 [Planctomyces sp. SH-PL62]